MPNTAKFIEKRPAAALTLPQATIVTMPLVASIDPANGPTIAPADWPVAVLAVMMFLLPALGVPNELMLQDTLKSALLAFGVLLAALVFFWQQRQRTEPLLWHGMVWLPLALMLYALGSMVWSHTYLAGVEAIRWFIVSLALWLGLNTLTRRNLPLLLWGVHGGAVIASVWTALQFWLDLQLFPQAAAPASTFINRNFFAEYAVSVLPVSVYLLANLRASRWLPLMALTLAFNLTALLMTGTRSALLALLVLLLLLVFILARYRGQLEFSKWPRPSKILIGCVLMFGVLGLGSLPSGNPQIIRDQMGETALERSYVRAASMTEGKEYTERSFSIRAQMWMATARMIGANPWRGVGAGAWEVQIPLYQRSYTVLETDYYAHNELLQLLSEYGVIVGGLGVAFLLAYLLHSAQTTWRLAPAAHAEAPLRAVLLAAMLAMLIVSNAGFPWHLAGCCALLALTLGVLAASDARLQASAATRLISRLPMLGLTTPLLGITLVCLLLAGFITLQAWRAERHLVHAIHLGRLLGQSLPAPALPEAQRKADMLASLRTGIAIHPHYRKITASVAESLAVSGDYANAAWVLETLATSRPHVAAIWTGLAINYAKLGQHERADAAYQHVLSLKPNADSSLALKARLLSLADRDDEAVQLVNKALDAQKHDFDLLQAGYALGLKAHNTTLAVRCLTLFNQRWPQHAADTYFRLGQVLAEAAPPDDVEALSAFRQGLAAVPPDARAEYIQKIPERLRSHM